MESHLTIGDTVRITSGGFVGYTGTICEIFAHSVRVRLHMIAAEPVVSRDMLESALCTEAAPRLGGGRTSGGGSTDYYKLPDGATDLQDLIEHKNMGFALGNIFKACYRFGEKDAASKEYDLNKIVYFAERMKAQIRGGSL